MSKTLTITINNIPEDQLAGIWKFAQKESKKTCGVPIVTTDNIVLDFAFIEEKYPDNREILSEIVGGAISGHVIMEADKILNP